LALKLVDRVQRGRWREVSVELLIARPLLALVQAARPRPQPNVRGLARHSCLGFRTRGLGEAPHFNHGLLIHGPGRTVAPPPAVIERLGA
jgi:hypothetical protein